MTNKTLKFVLVKNALPTAKEPYLGQFVSNGTTALDAFAEKVCAGRTNIDAPTLKLILRTAFTFIAEDMAENVFRYQTGLLTFEPAIEGSLPSMDAALTDENPLVVAVRLASEFAREIAAVQPTRDSDDAISVKIDDVLDVEAEKYHQITSGKRFQLTGKNISARGEGESLAVAGPDGIAHVCAVVEEDGMGQRIIAEAPSEANPGKGSILLTTRGYATPDADPIMVKKAVTIVEPPTPPEPRIVKVVSEATGQTGAWKAVADTLTVTTANAEGEDAELKLTLIEAGGRTTEMPLTGENKVERVDAKTMKVVITCNDSTEPDMVWQDPSATRRLTLTTGSGTASVDLAVAG